MKGHGYVPRKTDFDGKYLAKRQKKQNRDTPEIDQEDMFKPPIKKYRGPKYVPNTSKEAYHSEGVQKNLPKKMYIAQNLVRKFPGKTAHELLGVSQTFTDIYDLRRLLSALKKEDIAYNPSERKCNIVQKKTFTWALK